MCICADIRLRLIPSSAPTSAATASRCRCTIEFETDLSTSRRRRDAENWQRRPAAKAGGRPRSFRPLRRPHQFTELRAVNGVEHTFDYKVSGSDNWHRVMGRSDLSPTTAAGWIALSPELRNGSSGVQQGGLERNLATDAQRCVGRPDGDRPR